MSIYANNQKILSLQWIIWLFICGFFMGLAISVKFTALGVVGAVVVHQFVILFINYDREYSIIFKDIIMRFSLLFLPCIAIFLFLFFIHIQLLPYVGDGDAFMSHEFRARLLETTGEAQAIYKGVRKLGTWDSMIETISTMHEVNIALRATHPFQSYWYQWMFIQCKPVLYWQKLRAGYGLWVYCVGNAASWLFSATFGVIGFVIFSIFGAGIQFKLAFQPDYLSKNPDSFISIFQSTLEKYWWNAFILWVAYLGNYLPYILIPRAVWNYHYIPALLFSFMLCGVIAQILLDCLEKYDIIWFNILKAFFVIVIVSVTCCFLYLAPWTYALPLSELLHTDRFLFSSWEYKG